MSKIFANRRKKGAKRQHNPRNQPSRPTVEDTFQRLHTSITNPFTQARGVPVDSTVAVSTRPSGRRTVEVSQISLSGPDGALPITLETIHQRIGRALEMSLSELRELVRDGARPENESLQEGIISKGLTWILQRKDTSATPRREQIRCLRRLIYFRADTLLVARTGFGKSLIFQAFSLLTGLITIQLIPLSDLGHEQETDISRYDGATPCVVTMQTRRKDTGLLARIAARQHSHILLSPEQAIAPALLQLWRVIGSQIGLVAIDEVHLVRQWKDFRGAFTKVSMLRSVLGQGAVWFGCTGTLNLGRKTLF